MTIYSNAKTNFYVTNTAIRLWWHSHCRC